MESNANHGKAVASLVLGIVGILFWFSGMGSIISIVVGIIGIVLASQAKKAGNTEGIRTAGFVLSIISLVGGSVIFIVLILVVGSLSIVGASYGSFLGSFLNALE